MQLQRDRVLSERSEDTEESDYAESIYNLNHKDPICRILALGKLNEALKPYCETN
jgi:hypothetical protein